MGIPSSSNFPAAKEFPMYEKPKKPYRRGVEKAFEHMMTKETVGQYREHIDLIARMLHLDPSQRCKMEEALQPCTTTKRATMNTEIIN